MPMRADGTDRAKRFNVRPSLIPETCVVNFLPAWLRDVLARDLPIIHLGKTEITLGQLLAILTGVVVLFVASGWLRNWMTNRLLARGHIDLSMRYTVASLVRYVVLVVGFMVIMQTAGIDLTTFNVLAGAVGVGVGFGLQNIMSNFISGLIVMFERPVRVGDHVEMAGVAGDVKEIGARATHIVTVEGCLVIMPNQKFITDPVRNWAGAGDHSPLVLTVNLDKASDPRLAEQTLHEAVRGHAAVLDDPAPQVWLTGLAGNSSFKVLAWVAGGAPARAAATHELYLAIYQALAQRELKLA